MDYAHIAPMMGLLWSPLVAVTASWRGKDNAQIAVSTSGASIVPDMPRVIVQLYKTNFTHELVAASGAFGLCFMRKDQLDLVHKLGFSSGRHSDKLAGLRYEKGATGSPLFLDCWGYMDCRVIATMDGGDMTAFLGEVVAGGMRTEGEPLSWREMRQMMPASWHEEWDRKIQEEIEVSRRTMRRGG